MHNSEKHSKSVQSHDPIWHGESKKVPGTYLFGDPVTYAGHENKDKIGQTSFHRHAQYLQDIIYYLLEQPPKALNILSAPCSIGCEPYSFAMLALAEGLYRYHNSVKIDAVDLSPAFTKAARNGVYPIDMVRDVFDLNELRHFHIDDDKNVRISDRMKSRVKFLPSQDICNFSSDKNYDLMMMFNLLCKLDKDQTRQLAKSLCELKPSMLILNNMNFYYPGSGPNDHYRNPDWPILDRALKKAGYRVLGDDFKPIACGRNGLLTTHEKIDPDEQILTLVLT